MPQIKSFNIKIITLLALTAMFLVYSFWLYNNSFGQKATENNLAEQGKKVWQEKNCSACHQLYGLGGHLGPDLTNEYARRPVAYIRAILTAGTNVMPDFHLNNKDKDAIIAFLKYTNTTGTSDPKSYTTHIDGTITKP